MTNQLILALRYLGAGKIDEPDTFCGVTTSIQSPHTKNEEAHFLYSLLLYECLPESPPLETIYTHS
jgi:hypothetical protein